MSLLCVCLQGMDASQGGIQLVSRLIYKSLDIDVSVLMGANIASEVANGDFCESTLGMMCIYMYIQYACLNKAKYKILLTYQLL